MDTWSLPKARPISCNDCPAFQRHHMSIPWFAESFTLLLNLINTTFREKFYTRWCCIDRLSWQGFSECGPRTTQGLRFSRPSRNDQDHMVDIQVYLIHRRMARRKCSVSQAPP